MTPSRSRKTPQRCPALIRSSRSAAGDSGAAWRVRAALTPAWRPFYTPSTEAAMNEQLYPYLEDHLAVRLSEQGSEVRRRGRPNEIVRLGGSAQLFLARMNGRR